MGCECSSCSPEEGDKDIRIIAASGALLISGIILSFAGGLISVPFLLASVAAAGYRIFPPAIRSVLRGRFTVNFLILIAAAGAILLGDYTEAALVTVLYNIAEYLEEYAHRRSHRSVESLIKLRPRTARVLGDGENIIKVEEVRSGSIIGIKPGETIPLDGTVTRGRSKVDQSNITGESLPITVQEGSDVFAGTRNLDGYLEVRVTREADNTVLAGVIETVKRAATRRSRRERFIERFASVYTPAVIALAVLTAAVPIIMGGSIGTWVYRALVLLVISCPCALLISTPVAMVSGMTAAARRGILIKGSEFLEAMASVRNIIFDKTGTLTEGSPRVTSVEPVERKDEILRIAASLERRSGHPIAEAIVDSYHGETDEVSEFESMPGKGVSGHINGVKYTIGSPELVGASPGKGTTVYLQGPEGIAGKITLSDTIRDSASRTISELRDRGLEIMMLTGDTEEVAAEVAGELGVENYQGGLLPEDKMKVIDEVRKRGPVAMVGDGVNDAPALAAADVGIAMGVRGSDVALETADITLVEDDLERIDELMDLSRRTIRTVRINTALTVTVKLSLAVLSVTGSVPLWVAVAVGDMGLSLFVIVNSLLIARY
ncbi:cadmium-translocating P-type ATPase [Methanothermobacter marburgensis]|uniref:Predicted cation transport ATPase n=1 Tax=Methanothermobacter marburgensis (strain ATCC BAA-927 / DSM 2133 / JCM 14651 / NBRC 100331 / OCM 82 / Marburg) TaxID=79929 RepID=D9PW03_METTM|nr:cation-translocating P-type ATPase [Methanothermobacter marburgensis]ADL58401.1 predicted cation transport ATPase [Methanothermobacter marburgensis str. Marburg]WBF10544.1 cadmium-translocating P-type ATPase [Methanothermobacter marburgensis]